MSLSVVPDPEREPCPPVRPDIRAAISGLSDADHARLISYASAFALASRLEPQEIYSAAIVAALDETRVWPPDVELVAFLKMSMRSIASNEAKKSRRAPLFPVGGDCEGHGDLIETSASISDEGPRFAEASVVNTVDAKRLLDKVFALFEDDIDAQIVLMARLEDKDAADIKSEMQLNDTRYASITKRIKRRLVALANPTGII